MSNAPAILDLDDDHCIACWKSTFIQVWGKATRVEALNDTRRYLADFGRNGQKHLALIIVSAESAALDKTQREAFEAMTREMLDQCAAIAFAYEGAGLRATATRSALVAMTIAKPAAQYRVCKSVDEALAWLTRTAPEPEHGTAYERAHAVRTVRQRYYSRKQNGLVRAVAASN